MNAFTSTNSMMATLRKRINGGESATITNSVNIQLKIAKSLMMLVLRPLSYYAII
jgi:hypothetical protein